MDLSISIDVWHDEAGWHYRVKAFEGTTLLYAFHGEFIRGCRLDQVQAFASWIIQATARPRLQDDVFAPPSTLGVKPPAPAPLTGVRHTNR